MRHVVAAFSTVFALAIFIVNDAMRENLRDLRDDLAQETAQDFGAEQQYSVNSHLDDTEEILMRRIAEAQHQLDQHWSIAIEKRLQGIDINRQMSAFIRRTRESRERLSASRNLLEKIQDVSSVKLRLDFDQLLHDSLVSERAIADIVDPTWRHWNADKLPDSVPDTWEYKEEGYPLDEFPSLTDDDIKVWHATDPDTPAANYNALQAYDVITSHQNGLNRDIGFLITLIRTLAEEKVDRLEKQLKFWTEIGYGLYALLFAFNIWAVFFADSEPADEAG